MAIKFSGRTETIKAYAFKVSGFVISSNYLRVCSWQCVCVRVCILSVCRSRVGDRLATTGAQFPQTWRERSSCCGGSGSINTVRWIPGKWLTVCSEGKRMNYKRAFIINASVWGGEGGCESDGGRAAMFLSDSSTSGVSVPMNLRRICSECPQST